MNKLLISLVTMSAALVAASSAGAVTVSAETIKNLNAAHQGEANASHRYTLFAQKAQAEGYAQVARLFRAAAKAEEIHRDTHKATIVKLGGTVDPLVIAEVKPGTTAENLEAAIAGESYERDTMYPGFIATAKAEDARDAVRTFQFAVTAEKEHAILYKQALADLGKNAPADYYVCPVCGFTATALPGEKCPSCRNPTDKFIKVI